MRVLRSYLAILCCLMLAGPASGAFNAATAWDVRTGGSDANGGGFQVGATGTDRSVADAAFQSYTDILIDAATTKGSSAAHAFDATTPGNVFNITGSTDGTCTVQRVQAVSQVGGLVTFDKALGVAGSHCIGVQGGGLQTIATAAGLLVAGNSVYIQSGTYTLTAAVATPVVEQKYIGYNTTHPDLGTKPLITTATDSTDLFTVNGNALRGFYNLSMTNTAAVRAAAIHKVATSNGEVFASDVTFDGFTYAVQAVAVALARVTVDHAVVANSTVRGIACNCSVQLSGVWVHDSTQAAVEVGGSGIFTASRVLITDNGAGITSSSSGPSQSTISDSTVANNNGDGWYNNSGIGNKLAIFDNVVFWNNNGWAVAADAGDPYASLISTNNCIGGNARGAFGITAAATTVTPTIEVGTQVPAGDPFVNSAADDYTLNNTAGDGAVCRAAGFPGVFTGGPTGYPDIGAIQSQATGGGGTVGAAVVQ